MSIAALFPHGIAELFTWKPLLFDGTFYEFNKVGLLALVSAGVCLSIFVLGSRKQALVPTGSQNFAEISYEFVDLQISNAVLGEEGKKWTPFLGTLFFFILFMNIWSTVPVVQFPATSRIAIPLLLSVIVYFVYIGAGFAKQGPLYLFKAVIPPGVPWPMYIIIVPIEIISKFIVRPVSLAVRLFANMFAGHILMALFALMVAALLEMNSGAYQAVLAIFPLFGLIFMVAFEILVAVLQAYIFTVLSAVYIQDSISEEH